MRISEWSSDVCSSDLSQSRLSGQGATCWVSTLSTDGAWRERGRKSARLYARNACIGPDGGKPLSCRGFYRAAIWEDSGNCGDIIITSVRAELVEGLFFLSTQESRTVLRQAQPERVFFGGCARYGGVGCGAGSGVGAPAGGRSPRGRRRSIAVPLTSVRITACPSCKIGRAHV